MNTITEETASTPATATTEQPKAAKKAGVGKRAHNVAPAKGKSGKKASVAKKAHKGPKGAKPAKQADGAREGSKASKILDLLKRPGGVSLKEIMKATDWQAHSVRGFLSGTLRKKMGLDVASTKGEDGQRSYSVKA
jgi:hypothetical protein